MDVAQTASFLHAMTYEAGILEYDEFPVTAEPVHILGCQYSAIHELEDIKHDFISRVWLTYRRGFASIGGGGPTGDAGWGCMLRCGQMMLAQALVNRHLGRDWRWMSGKYDPKYFEILRMFLDKKGSTYSIHQIASMGASEGKEVGEWFGPNTIAQVLKKLAIYDEWSNIVIHVALDNTVIIDDLRTMCLGGDANKKEAPFNNSEEVLCTWCRQRTKCSPPPNIRRRVKQHRTAQDETINCDIQASDCVVQSDIRSTISSTEQCNCSKEQSTWSPLLLIIPLRLGLSEINPVYISALKTCLRLPQSVGIIGGKPNHAHWFIGYVEDELLYLDPHTTQSYTDVTQPEQTDESYHCEFISRMRITNLDPSIAVGFFCGSEVEFKDLCLSIQKFIISAEKTPMFELHQQRPPHWPPFENYSPEGATGTDFTILDEAERQFDTDEEFELL